MAAFESVYARAFSDVVASGGTEQAQNFMHQLESFEQTYRYNRELREVLSNPSVPEKQKLALLTALCLRAGASEQVRNFLAVIIRHDRVGSLTEILSQTQDELNRRLRVVEAEVITARPVGEEAKQQFAESIRRLAGNQQVRAHYREDSSLLGGALVRIGSTVYDGSVRGQLQKLKERLAAS